MSTTNLVISPRTMEEWKLIGEEAFGPFCTALSGVEENRLRATASGILVRVDDRYCILTAHHVLYGGEGYAGVLNYPALSFWISRGDRQPFYPTELFTPVPIAEPRAGAEEKGPDLAALILPDDIASQAEIRHKAFYNLGRHRQSWQQFAAYDDSSAWILSGVPKECHETTEDGIAMQFLLGLCGPPLSCSHGGFEFLDVRASYEAPADPPRTFAGMSGGGLWALKERTTGGWSRMLMGVAFCQLPPEESHRVVRCHGAADLYGRAYDVILEAARQPNDSGGGGR